MPPGSMGASARDSTATNAMTATPARANAPTINGLDQPSPDAGTSPNFTADSHTTPSAAPPVSIRPAPGSADSGTWRAVRNSTTAAIGTLMRNTQRQVVTASR